MKKLIHTLLAIGVIVGCTSPRQAPQETASVKTASDTLPAPYATRSVMNFSNVIGCENGKTPAAPEGFVVVKYAEGFENPRWLYALPNGDVLVAESNSNHVADLKNEKVHGRPVGVLVTADGSLLVADDVSNMIWKVSRRH